MTDSNSQSATADVKDKAQEATQQAREQARTRVSGVVDERSTQAGEQVSSTAQALRKTSEELHGQGQSAPARAVESLADRVEGVGSWLRDSDGDTLLQDVEDFARRNPTAVMFGGLALGFAASRLLRASSSRRSSSRDYSPRYGRNDPLSTRGRTTPAIDPVQEGLLPEPTPPGTGVTTGRTYGQGMGTVGGEAEGFTPPRGA